MRSSRLTPAPAMTLNMGRTDRTLRLVVAAARMLLVLLRKDR